MRFRNYTREHRKALHRKAFLQTAANTYKYDFSKQLLIYAQKQSATACATFDEWKEILNRKVNPEAESIRLIDSSTGFMKLQYVYDISDTSALGNESRTPYIWKYNNHTSEAVSKTLSAQYGANAIGVNNQLMQIVSRIMQEQSDFYLERFKTLLAQQGETSPSRQMLINFKAVLEESIKYSMLFRTGFDSTGFVNEKNLNGISSFKNSAHLNILGNAVSTITEQVFRSIEKSVKSFESELRRKAAFERRMEHETSEHNRIGDTERANSGRAEGSVLSSDNEILPGNENGRERNSVQTGRENIHVQSDIGSSDRLQGGANRKIRQDEVGLSDRNTAVESERNDDELHAEQLSSESERTGTPENGSADKANVGERGTDRGTERNGLDGIHSASEEHTVSGGGNSQERDNIRINTETAEVDDTPAVSAVTENEQAHIIGNTSFKYIKAKRYKKLDTETALKIAEQLKTEGVKFSGRGSENQTV